MRKSGLVKGLGSAWRWVFRGRLYVHQLVRFEFACDEHLQLELLPNMTPPGTELDELGAAMQSLGRAGVNVVVIGQIVRDRKLVPDSWWAETSYKHPRIRSNNSAGMVEAVTALDRGLAAALADQGGWS